MRQGSPSSVKGAGGLHQVLRGQLRWVFIKFKGDRAGGLHQVLREQGGYLGIKSWKMSLVTYLIEEDHGGHGSKI